MQELTHREEYDMTAEQLLSYPNQPEFDRDTYARKRHLVELPYVTDIGKVNKEKDTGAYRDP